MSEADDARLLAAAADGDRRAFARFVDRHEASVLRYLRAAAAQDADADDAFQEAFLAAWRGAGGFRGEGSARAWMLTVARNALRRHHRRRAGEPTGYEPLEDLDHLGRAAGWGRPEPAEEALEREDLLRWALDGLAPGDREILVLRELEGLGGEEVAELLGLSLAAQKSRLHRARLRFVARVRSQALTDDEEDRA